MACERKAATRATAAFLTGLLLATLAGCRLEIGDAPVAGNRFAATVLVSSQPSIPADDSDARLIDPRGLAFGPGPAWIANRGSNTVTSQPDDGSARRAIAIPGGSQGAAAPSGLVVNTFPGDFFVTTRGVTAPADFIVAGEGGTLAAWSVRTGFGESAVTVHDGGADRARYTGLALQRTEGRAFLFAADFRNGRINTFDNAFNATVASGGFIDADVPDGYAPFNIQAVGSEIVVTYAQRENPDSARPLAGPGLGRVSIFDGQGRLLRRLVTEEELNAPWGIALAPPGFGGFGGALLVGNHGDGRINAYDFSTGQHLGTLRDAFDEPLVIEGLRALAFGNGVGTRVTTALFFTAGTNAGADGTFGRIDNAVGRFDTGTESSASGAADPGVVTDTGTIPGTGTPPATGIGFGTGTGFGSFGTPPITGATPAFDTNLTPAFGTAPATTTTTVTTSSDGPVTGAVRLDAPSTTGTTGNDG